ncbi:hypothetical protein N7539_001430 [Penicillium diatomitis]|uniref:Uncharacterized protein n=1 Tax=Penicillium diatomitis TaxID=2819901 RepID=A0A9X0C071_9EURO|nr:uncharacterized protein N7539_001430 [Penicillium diatomitis]KAJ5492684.1 hypothetical protein N7539_001430 [Penicillium diatomitis]
MLRNFLQIINTLPTITYSNSQSLIRPISNLLRNLIIYYVDTRTFLKYYLNRRINKNLPTIIRGLNLDNNIIYIAYRISRIINPDRL